MRITAALLIIALQAGMVSAGTLPASISRRPYMVRPPSERVTVGVTYDEIERRVDLDDGPDALLDVDSLALYAGYDLFPWLTVFATLGGAELDGTAEVDTDSKLKVSAGACAYVWEGDILEPEFMAGRVTLKPVVEISRYASDSSVGDVKWVDFTAAMLLGYERFDRYPPSPQGVETSLALYVGPALSYVTGIMDTAVGDIDFKGDELLGVVGGIDIYLAPSVSLGFQFGVYDETTIGANMRFHL
jgi:hypothetical protein